MCAACLTLSSGVPLCLSQLWKSEKWEVPMRVRDSKGLGREAGQRLGPAVFSHVENWESGGASEGGKGLPVR